MDSNTKEVLQEVMQRMDTLFQKIGAGAEVGWDVLVQKIFWVDGVFGVVRGLGVALLIILAILILWSKYNKVWKHDDHRGEGWFVLLVVSVIGVLATAFCVDTALDAATRILIPEYYAVEELLKLFK